MIQGAIGVAVCVGGLFLAFSSHQIIGLLMFVLGMGVVNGASHDVWLSFDFESGADTGDGYGSDGDGGGGGDGD